jgi:hypothetical protein
MEAPLRRTPPERPTPQPNQRKEASPKYEVDLAAKLEAELNAPVDIRALNEIPTPFRNAVFADGTFSRAWKRGRTLSAKPSDDT